MQVCKHSHVRNGGGLCISQLLKHMLVRCAPSLRIVRSMTVSLFYGFIRVYVILVIF